jgi:hypothetical protein
MMCLEAKGDLSPSYEFEAEEDIAFALRLSNDQWNEIKTVLLRKSLIARDGNGYRILYRGGVKKGSNRPNAKEWAEIRAHVFERDNYTCTYCGLRGVALQCDHVHPISRGGSNDLSNLTTACAKCNMSKHDKTVEEWKGVN